MGGGTPFHVDPAALESAAKGFDAQASTVARMKSSFTGPAHLVDGAFGLLGPSDQLLREYDQAVSSALSGLDKLHQVLGDAARKLHTAADNYRAADRPIGG
jgi:Excreted virulence factor EspC, type VII ESX diderm